jgi:uncharacterized protein YndB with AHSA1/START domain
MAHWVGDVGDLGTVTRSPDGLELRYLRRLAHPIETVWAAVTEPTEMAAWWADADVDLRVGGAVELRWLNTDPEGNRAVAKGTVTAVDPPRTVEYSTDIHGVLRFELTADGDATVLVFTATYPPSMSEELSVTAGWHIHLEHLATVLGGGTVDWDRWYAVHFPRWETIRDAYAEQGVG